jgi:integrase
VEGKRINGPYKHGDKWRLVVTYPDRSQVVESYASRAQAIDIRDAAREQIEGRTVSRAVEAYEESLRDRGLAPASIRMQRYLFDKLFDEQGHRLLAWLTPKRADDLYSAMRSKAAVASHHVGLTIAKQFGRWLAKRGWVDENPFADVHPVGRAKRGKPQLRVDESRKLVAVCLAENSPASIAVATALLLGVRSSETWKRVCRDLDDDGRLYWIDSGKTKGARRCLEVPEVLRPALLELAGDRPSDAPLFGPAATNAKWLRHHTARLCRKAKVPVVPPHGLRGTHSTIARAAGASAHVVAAQLGHASPATTEAHYIAPGTSQRAAARAMLTVLDGGNRGGEVGYHGAANSGKSAG